MDAPATHETDDLALLARRSGIALTAAEIDAAAAAEMRVRQGMERLRGELGPSSEPAPVFRVLPGPVSR